MLLSGYTAGLTGALTKPEAYENLQLLPILSPGVRIFTRPDLQHMPEPLSLYPVEYLLFSCQFKKSGFNLAGNG